MATRKMLVYLDQNILGYLHSGKLRLPILNDVDWVYSSEHFNEMRRGDPKPFLSVLRDLKANQIRLDLDDHFRITDQALLDNYSCPFERYEKHIETVDEIPFDESPQFELLARLFGADNFKKVSDLPDILISQIDELLEPHGDTASSIKLEARKMAAELQTQIETKLDKNLSLKEIRKSLGDSKNRIGDVKADNPILEIWEIIKNQIPELTIDQYFGFDPIVKIGQEQRSTFEGIIGCHVVLNFLGYRKDEGTNNPTKWSNILSDGQHIAYGAFCDALLSEDRRFCLKAKAIYNYLDAGTHTLRLETKTTK